MTSKNALICLIARVIKMSNEESTAALDILMMTMIADRAVKYFEWIMDFLK